MNWSPQQAAFLDWCENGSGSCVLIAVAGAGKTTVLIEGGKRIRGGVGYMAFNAKIVEEANAKLKKMGVDWKKMNAKTAHSFGMGAYKKFRPNVVVNKYKVDDILNKMLPELHPLKKYQSHIGELISLAKQRVFGLLTALESFDEWASVANHYDVFDEAEEAPPLGEIFEVCIEALKASMNQFDVIDFDDMIYMPLVHRLRFWQHDVVMIDEAQDTNPARRALAAAMLKKGGRLIAVGDPHQAIYGFTGADADALDLIAKDFNCVKLDLTVSFRCPQKVVTFAQRWVSHITAADTAAEGEVSQVTLANFVKRNDLKSGAAVLCRVTKPLVALAFDLIRRRIACRVEGREVGGSLKKLMQRWKLPKESAFEALEEKLDEYLAAETTKLLAKRQETRLATIEDAVETIRVIIEECRKEDKHSIDDALAYVDNIFGDNVEDVMVLSTIHRAKGREWSTVFWLDRNNTCPSPWARQKWQQEQEKNLCYVAATRSQDRLIEVTLPAKQRKAA